MSSNGKRDVLRSIDYLLYCHIAYTYFLDASVLVLLFRILLQLQLLSPRALNRSLRTALAIVTSGWLMCLLLHAITEPGEPGIIIDFIGNQQKPSIFRLFMLDCVVYILQIIRVLITSSLSSQLLLNGTVVTTLTVPPALATALGAETVTLMLPPREGSNSEDSTEDLFYHHDLVVDIGLRSSVRNIMYADMEDPSTARDGSERLPV
ncbi:uncharacterized protein B0P05DRAFT_563784 [Gilbertella persicaria]|uniref:DUF1746 domain-containing protein n=1 Tax=Rhizopus stolonifer TaxID=4846 RepID=A0A367K8H0_RHIST|nr:uncharacterized protein B0P05DRAFT_563784 [Gilbertella persicaria]KAI8049116.1 hypothetical protein B0P05DRAFT_563784 [Gilbertella persicaria]RCH98514.1 hypothetical protein CU098_004902 [Rhizopus stolonifer]